MYKEKLLVILDKTFLSDSFGFGVDTYRKWKTLKKKVEVMNENQARELLTEIKDLKVKKEVEKVERDYRMMQSDLISRRDEFFEKAKEQATDIARDISDEKAEEFWEKRAVILTQFNKRLRNLVQMRDQKIKRILTRVTHLSPKQLGGVVTAAAIIAIAIRASQTFTEYAKDKCLRIKDSRKRKLCVVRWKEQYYKKRLNSLRDHVTKCKYAKDPVECRNKIDKEMLKIVKQIDNVKGDVLEKYAEIRS